MKEKYCNRCGKPLAEDEEDYCEECFSFLAEKESLEFTGQWW